MARSPAEVLVAVGVEFCGVRQSRLQMNIEWRSDAIESQSLEVSLELPTLRPICVRSLEGRGAGADGMRLRGMYHSISGGPGQGPGLVNGLAENFLQTRGALSLTFAGAGHGCGGTRSVDTESSPLQTSGWSEVDGHMTWRVTPGHVIAPYKAILL